MCVSWVFFCFSVILFFFNPTQVSLARVLCDNVRTIDFLQPNVFLESDPFLNALMPCTANTVIQRMNLNAWATASPRH